MLIGYMRVSKNDGSQTLDLQRDALIASGVDENRLYHDYTTTPNGRLVFGLFAALAEFERELIVERTNAGLAAARARGRMGGRPRKVDVATLKMASAAMSDSKSIAKEVAKKLNITTATLYAYVNNDGSLKIAGAKLLEEKK